MKLLKLACLATLAFALFPTVTEARSRWSVHVGFGGGCGPAWGPGWGRGWGGGFNNWCGPRGGIGYGYSWGARPGFGYGYGYCPPVYDYYPPVVHQRPIVIERPVYITPVNGFYTTPAFQDRYVSYNVGYTSYRSPGYYQSYQTVNYQPYSRNVQGYQSYQVYYRR
jgi:hypothetical protein